MPFLSIVWRPLAILFSESFALQPIRDGIRPTQSLQDFKALLPEIKLLVAAHAVRAEEQTVLDHGPERLELLCCVCDNRISVGARCEENIRDLYPLLRVDGFISVHPSYPNYPGRCFTTIKVEYLHGSAALSQEILHHGRRQDVLEGVNCPAKTWNVDGIR